MGALGAHALGAGFRNMKVNSNIDIVKLMRIEFQISIYSIVPPTLAVVR